MCANCLCHTCQSVSRLHKRNNPLKMGQRFEQTVLEGRHTSASSSMKTLTCLFKKPQKHGDALPHTTPNSRFRRKSQETAGAGKEMKKGRPAHCC